MRRLAMLALALTMSACSLDSTGPNGEIDATFTLRTIDGHFLPYRFSNGVTLTSDELTLYEDGTYTDVSRYESGSSHVDEGFYTNVNGTLTFESRRTNVVSHGSLIGDRLTQVIGGYTQIFERR